MLITLIIQFFSSKSKSSIIHWDFITTGVNIKVLFYFVKTSIDYLIVDFVNMNSLFNFIHCEFE